MGQNEKEILKTISEAIGNPEGEKAIDATKAAIQAKIPAIEIVQEGIAGGLDIVGKRYETGEYFLAELIVSGETAKSCTDLIESLPSTNIESAGRIVLGTVKHDMHNIGKDVVKLFLTGAGFTVYDLGVDVPTEKFVEKAKEVDADIIGISALLSMTVVYIKEVITALKEAGIRDKVKVIIGGAVTTPKYAAEIGADGQAKNAAEAVDVARELIKKKEKEKD